MENKKYNPFVVIGSPLLVGETPPQPRPSPT